MTPGGPLILSTSTMPGTSHLAPYELARRNFPEAVARAPRWVFDRAAGEEIVAYFQSASQEEQDALFQKFVPRPEVVIEFGACCAVYVHRSSDLYEAQKSRYGAPADDDRMGDSMARLFMQEAFTSQFPTIDAAARNAQATSYMLYVARQVAADRYVDRVAGSRVRRRMSNARIGEVSVRWDAPTLRYHGQRALEELREREEQERQARCQHSVREFLRVRNGRVEYVRAHTRGDPSVPRRATRVTGGGKAAEK